MQHLVLAGKHCVVVALWALVLQRMGEKVYNCVQLAVVSDCVDYQGRLLDNFTSYWVYLAEVQKEKFLKRN